MHVVVCSVIPPLFLPWQLDFASPRSHYCMKVTECFVFPEQLEVDPLSKVLTLNVLVFGFRFIAIPSITSNVPVHFTAINQCPTWPVPF